MPLDPCFRPLLDAMAARAAAGPPAADPIAAARAGVGAMFTHSTAPVVGVLDRTIPGPGGELPIRIYTPEAGSRPLPVQ